ncbi:MAG: ATP-binding protein [Actinomycetales bacterium]
MELIAELGSGPREVSRARRALAAALDTWGLHGEAVDVAILLTSELVTNAIRHGSGPVRLSAGLDSARVLRVEVRDHEVRGLQVRDAQEDDEDGRGLQLVDVLADAWGWQPGNDGKHVWFELGPS